MPDVTMNLAHDLDMNRPELGTQVRAIIAQAFDVDPNDQVYLTVIVHDPAYGDHQPCDIFVNIVAQKTKQRKNSQEALVDLIKGQICALKDNIRVVVRLELAKSVWGAANT